MHSLRGRGWPTLAGSADVARRLGEGRALPRSSTALVDAGGRTVPEDDASLDRRGLTMGLVVLPEGLVSTEGERLVCCKPVYDQLHCGGITEGEKPTK